MRRGFVVVLPDGTWALVVAGDVVRVGIVGERPTGWQLQTSARRRNDARPSMRRSQRLGFNAYRG